MRRGRWRWAPAALLGVLAPGIAGAQEGQAQEQEATPQTAPALAPADEAQPGASTEPSASGTTTTPTARAPIEVQVIGDRSDALRRLPGSGTVIGQEQIDRAQPREVSEMLQRVPGLSVRQGIQAGNRMDISVRGIDAQRGRRVLILEDGVPQAINPYGEPDLYYTPPIERMRGIEVVKGAGSILFGPQTIGGVINFRTLAPPERRTLSLEVEGGDPAYVQVLGAYGDRIGDDVGFVGQVFHERGEDFREEGFAATDGLAKVTFATSRAGQATLKVSFHDEIADTSEAGLTREMFVDDPRRPTLSPYDRMSIRRYEVALTHEVALGERTTLRTLAYAYTTKRLWRFQTYARSPAPGVQYERVVGDPRIPNGAVFFEDATSVSDRSYDVAAIEPRLEQRLVTGPFAHRFIAGVRLLGETGDRAARRGEHRTSYAGSLESLESARTFAFAAYVEDEIAVRDYLLVTPGVRYEYATQRRHIERAFVEGEPRDVDIVGHTELSEAMPGLGVVLGRRDTHAFAGVHVGFAPPRLTSAIRADGIDAQLDAERSVNWEVGARIGPVPWLRVEGTGFLSRFDNQVIPTPAGAAGLELQNAGETLHSGAEVGARLLLGRALRLPLGVDISGNYTVSRAVFAAGDNDGNTLPYAPRHLASGALDVTHAIGLGGQIAASYVGDQFSDEANTGQEDAGGRFGLLPEHVAVDLAARYRHARSGLGATVSVKNAFDDIYVQGRRPDGIFPAGNRQVYLGLRWDWVMAPAPDEDAAQ